MSAVETRNTFKLDRTPGIAARILAREDHPPVPEESGHGPDLRKLIRALAAIGLESAGQPFALSALMVAERFGVVMATAHYWLLGLKREGLIKVIDPGRPGAGGRGRARRLVWLGAAGAHRSDEAQK